MPVRVLVAALVSLGLALGSAAPAEGSRQKAAGKKGKGRRGSTITRALVRRGYSRSVARRIEKHRPELARSLASGGPDSEPVLLYRGLRVPPNRFVPTGKPGKSEQNSTRGRLWFSQRDYQAGGYAAKRSKHTWRTVIEVEMPLRYWSLWKTNNMGITSDGHVSKSEVPDLSPFITRIGVLRRGDPANKIRWFSFDQAVRLRLLTDEIDYTTLLAN